METVRIRLTGTETAANALITLLHGLEGIERVEEIADDMPHMDDEDSSSAGLSDDTGPGVHDIEIEAPGRYIAEVVRNAAETVAEDLKATVEFVDEF